MTEPAWAEGYDVAYLKSVTAMFKAHDAGMVHGAFGRYSELDAVADLKRDALEVGLGWAMAGRLLDRRTPVKDFTGDLRTVLQPGVFLVTRMAWTCEEGRDRLAERILKREGPVAVWAWQEHAEERRLVGSLRQAAVKITAASEMRGLYVDDPWLARPYVQHQALTLGRLPVRISQSDLRDLTEQAAGLDFAQHYSSYNKADSWTAVALRGFFDDPQRIEKPREMNKRWKREHEAELANEPRDTELRALLPAVEAIIGAIPAASLERVRLMRLAPGGGELTRHADITDADAGAEVGRVVRLHFPLLTNPDCVFHGWDLDGKRRRRVMEPGGVFYLDMRKPHTAFNGGQTERLHLVIDMVADEALVAHLSMAEEAPYADEEQAEAEPLEVEREQTGQLTF